MFFGAPIEATEDAYIFVYPSFSWWSWGFRLQVRGLRALMHSPKRPAISSPYRVQNMSCSISKAEKTFIPIPIVLIAPLMQLILCGKLHWSRYETLVYCVKGEILLKLELSTVSTFPETSLKLEWSLLLPSCHEMHSFITIQYTYNKTRGLAQFCLGSQLQNVLMY